MNDTQQKLLKLGQIVYARDGSLPVIQRGSHAWSEWRQWRIDNGLSVRFFDTRDTWTVPSELPPVDLNAALVAAGPAGKSIKAKLAV